MNIVRILDSRLRYVATAVLLMAVAIVPSIASAAQVTDRSVALSSSSATATGVTYEVKFTAVNAASSVVIDFCGGSPLIGQTCGALPGFSVSAATTSDATRDAATTATKFVGTKSITAGEQTITLTGVTNPTAAGTIYARILTFGAGTGHTDYTSTTPGTYVDNGSAAIAITSTVGVSGAVLETLTFCVFKDEIGANCTPDEEGDQAPTVRLGTIVDGVPVLDPGTVHTDSIHTQLSTNAVGGAVVNLKSNALGCGGLFRIGALADCDIKPALTGETVAANDSRFGVRLGTATGLSGVLQPRSGSIYDTTNYRMHTNIDNSVGVTSLYGDPMLDTDDAPADDVQMELTFAAAVNNNTPAGMYSADLSLIATGKF